MGWVRLHPRTRWLALALIMSLAVGAQAEKRTFTFASDTSFLVGNAPRIRIENQSGDVTVIAGSSNVINVTARRLIPAADSAGAAMSLESSRVDYDRQGDRLQILARVDRSGRERVSEAGLIGLHEQERGTIHLEIEVPSECDVEVSTASGDQWVRGVEGTIRTRSASGQQALSALRGRLWVASASGDVTLSDCATTVNLEVTSGSVTVSNLTADATLRSTSGDVQIREATGQVSVTTSSGNLKVVGLDGSLVTRTTSGSVITRDHRGSLAVRTGSGRVELELGIPPGETASISTGSGDVALICSRARGCALEIYPGSGTLKDDLGVDWETRSRLAYRGRIGDQPIAVRIETGSGDIWLKGGP